MNNISKEIKNDDGTIETLVITSNDNHNLDMSQTYKLANHKPKKESALVKKFKGSILGADIGIKSGHSSYNHCCWSIMCNVFLMEILIIK